LNHHTDELSCAIGLSSLGSLADTIIRRLAFVADLTAGMLAEIEVCRPYGYSPSDSPFVYPIFVDTDRVRCTTREFAFALQKEGIDLNPHYEYVVADWPWVGRHLADDFETPNARGVRDRSFAMYLNENYGQREVHDIITALGKIQQYYR
jgi:dTDP-4-amino-4,6-dideoxygalactose transaminase